MADIVERLRAEASDNKRYLVPDGLALDAANEIESLRFQLNGVMKMRNEAEAEVKLIVRERDRTFALMLARAEKAEAEVDRLRAALEEITKVERYYGYEADEMLNIARAALGGEND